VPPCFRKVQEMSELLSNFGDAVPYLKAIALVIGLALGLIAAAAAMYVLRTALGPLGRVAQWMFAHTPGERPSQMVAGISFGGRMLAWAGLIGIAVWFLVH
jgi:hypothetical protein